MHKIIFLIVLVFVSCNNKSEQKMSQKIKIEFQHFEGCPNGPKLLNNLNEAIKGIEDSIDFIEEIVDSPELAKKHNFRGSPTILVNGKDIEGMPMPDNPSLSCRLYSNGLPNSAFIRQYIQTVLKERN